VSSESDVDAAGGTLATGPGGREADPLAERGGWGWRHVHWFWPALLVIAVGDLASKAWIFADPAAWADHEFIYPAINKGIAFSLFAAWPEAVQWATLLLIIGITVVYLRFFRHQGRLVNFAFGCVLGGAVGNGFDRLVALFSDNPEAGVRDFISIDLNYVAIDYIWPTFNVADIGITIGFVALLLSSFTEREPEQGPSPEG